ncbi:MAG: TIGR02281 family clan AA aspartic protease [Candidatus Omnitrophica bacterium]|nr:TIGR02281 family clan AA aspartic protease [Candidatus Omnitrophota bacterium]
MNAKKIIITLILISLCGAACADIVHFKDGGSVQGVISEETEEKIVIDIGFGTMTVKPEEIDYIEESSPEVLDSLKKEMLNYEIGKGEWAPDGSEDIRILYTKSMADKKALMDGRSRKKELGEEIQRKASEISEILETLDKKGRRLNEIEPDNDVKRYNEIATEINSLNVDLDRANKKTDSLYDEEKELNARLVKLASNYRSGFELFKSSYDAKRSGVDEGSASSDELHFFQEMDSKLKTMGQDFKEDIASYTPDGDHVIVDAIINGRASARLMVDTGASIVIISQSVALRLGLGYDNIQNEIDIVMADGSVSKARPVILDSVKVGDAKVEKVQAAVIENADIGGVEGLLGMSFLSNFVIKFDSSRNELILERVL